ncbi:MAG: SseB family protein [Caulobacteraceae bacterium]|nr:SseB family protein [Caulobacteraceae bacterium]
MTAADFTPLNDLERLLVAATGGDAEARRAFEAAVLEHDLWAAVPAGADPAADPMTLVTGRAKDGTPATALFTARERAEATLPEATAVGFPGRDLLTSVMGRDAVLNPGHGHGVKWSSAAIRTLLGLETLGEGMRTPVAVARPKETPKGLVEGVTRVLGAAPQVKGAWLALARWADADLPGFLLDVRIAPEHAGGLQSLLEAALAEVELDACLDVVTRRPGEAAGAGLELIAPR